MKASSAVRILPIVVMFLATTADAEPCRHCGRTAAGTPFVASGCGPRYWGAVHDEPNVPDPCDACGRWRGCGGDVRGPEMLAPWQLPPGRGFRSPSHLGYAAGPCRDCGPTLRPWKW